MYDKTDIFDRKQPCDNNEYIYFLFDGEELVYVGQTTNIYQRIGVHMKKKTFDSFSKIKVDLSQKELDLLETHYILNFKPKYNNRLPENPFYKTFYQIQKIIGTRRTKEIKKMIKETGAEQVGFGCYDVRDFGWKVDENV